MGTHLALKEAAGGDRVKVERRTSMSEMTCPNCGRHLVNYRTERQVAGRREVELKWTICVHCRHVALDSWSFADGTIPPSRVSDDAMGARRKRVGEDARRRA
jgi:C4-type Zn-finger protein